MLKDRRETWIVVRNTGLAVLTLAFGRASYELIVKFNAMDPFAAYRHGANSTLPEQLGIRMENVELRQYHEGKLVARAHVAQLDVRRDRAAYDLVKISDGVFHTDNNKVMHFQAANGRWLVAAQRLTTSGGAKVWNADLDLSAERLSIDKRWKRLDVPVPVIGHVAGGVVKAEAISYHLDTGNYETGAISWEGTNKTVQEVTDGPPHKWKFEAAGSNHDNGVENYTNGTASDGEVIVKAPHLERVAKTDVLTATGRVSYFSAKANMMADKVVVFRKERRAVLTGNVVMLVKPKKDENKKVEIEEIPPFRPDVPASIADSRPVPKIDKTQVEELRSGKTLRDFPLRMTAEKITYWYAKKNRHAHVEGKPYAFQELSGGRWRKFWSFEASYDAEQETLVLISSPKAKHDTFEVRMMNSLGDDMHAKTMTTSTKDEDDELRNYSAVEPWGNVTDTDDEIPRDDSKKPASSSGDKGTPPATPGEKGPGEKQPGTPDPEKKPN